MAQILYFALSRKREFLADAGAVRLTRYPEGLASALEKIAGSKTPMQTANKVTAPMYISSPFRGQKASLFSTHPSAEQRIHVLRAMMHGANFQDYDQAYRSVTGKSGVIPASALKDSESSPTRQADTRSEPMPPAAAKAQERIRFGDFLRQQRACLYHLPLRGQAETAAEPANQQSTMPTVQDRAHCQPILKRELP
jgi:heat shock protein HtpX